MIFCLYFPHLLSNLYEIQCVWDLHIMLMGICEFLWKSSEGRSYFLMGINRIRFMYTLWSCMTFWKQIKKPCKNLCASWRRTQFTVLFLCLLDRASSWYLNKDRPTWCHLLYYFIIYCSTCSNVSTSIFRSLRLIVDLFHVLYCSGLMCVGVTVWFGWGGVLSLCRLRH
jgi:hypothetical protein